jgi:hypothetical protein
LRARLIEPNKLGRPAHDLIAAFLQRQVGTLGQIFRLRRDLPGLGQQQTDLDRIPRRGIGDEWLRERRRSRGQGCRAHQRPAARHEMIELIRHLFLLRAALCRRDEFFTNFE